MLLLYYTMQRLLGWDPVPHRREKDCYPVPHRREKDCYLVPYKVDWSAFLYTEGTRLLSCAIQSGLVFFFLYTEGTKLLSCAIQSGLLLSCIIHSEQGIILYNTEGTDQLLSCTIQRGLSL